MAEELAETVDAGRLHLEIRDTVGAIGETGEPVDEFRLGEAETEDPALRTIEPGACNGDALMEAAGEMPEQRSAGAADIWLGQAVMELRLGGEGMEELPLFFGGFIAVKIQQVIDAQ